MAVKVEKTIDDLNDAKMSRLLIEQFESELETLYTHAHANICALVGHSEDGPSRALVYEFCANGALYDRIACAKGDQWGQASRLIWTSQLAPGVISYSSVISACAKGQQWEQARRLLLEMWTSQLAPGVISYKSVISA